MNVTHQEIGVNLASQTNIGHAGVVNIHPSPPPPSQKDVDDALRQPGAAASPSVREGAYHDQIDGAVAYMKEGKEDVAVELLLRLKKREWDRMTGREKFRTLANLGHCRSRREEYVQALADFREALTYQPEDLEGRCFVAAAEFSAGNDDSARRLAEEILDGHPDAVYAHVVMLKTTSADDSAESLWKRLPQTVQNTTPILVTLGWRAANQREFAFARYLALKGMEDDDNKTEFEVLEVAILIGDLSLRIMSNPPATAKEVESLTAAIDKLNTAEKDIKRTPAKQQLGQVYYYQACAYRLLDNKVEAEHAYKEAIKVWPGAIDVGRQYVMLLNEQARLADAISVLDGNDNHSANVESCILLAHCLAERNQGRDKERARVLLQDVIRRLGEVDLATISNALNLLARRRSSTQTIGSLVVEEAKS